MDGKPPRRGIPPTVFTFQLPDDSRSEKSRMAGIRIDNHRHVYSSQHKATSRLPGALTHTNDEQVMENSTVLNLGSSGEPGLPPNMDLDNSPYRGGSGSSANKRLAESSCRINRDDA
jgi:hypothetical protein